MLLLLLLLLLFEVVGEDADHVGDGGERRRRGMIRERLRVGEERMLRRRHFLFGVLVAMLEERRRKVVQHVSLS